MRQNKAIDQALHSGGVDHLYLDNTFSHFSYDFPSREEVQKKVIEVIQ